MSDFQDTYDQENPYRDNKLYVARDTEYWAKCLREWMPKGIMWDEALQQHIEQPYDNNGNPVLDPQGNPIPGHSSNWWIFLNSIAHLFADIDYQNQQSLDMLFLEKSFAQKAESNLANGLSAVDEETESSEGMMDYYWDMFQLSQLLDRKPTNPTYKFKIIRAFILLKTNPVFTAAQIKAFIYGVFDIDIDMQLLDSHNFNHSNYLDTWFNFYFMDFEQDEKNLIIMLPSTISNKDRNMITSLLAYPEYADNPDINNFADAMVGGTLGYDGDRSFLFEDREVFVNEIRTILDIIIPLHYKVIYVMPE
jgi:hypothetical protein